MFDMSILYCEKDNKKSRRDVQIRLLSPVCNIFKTSLAATGGISGGKILLLIPTGIHFVKEVPIILASAIIDYLQTKIITAAM